MQTSTNRSIDLSIGKGRPVLRLVLLGLALSLLALPIIRTQAAAPGNRSFLRTWERPDKPVADKRVDRTWMWGPEAFTTLLTEPYVDSPGGQRTIQYFDKSRMEITDPNGDVNADWYVTNGLLVVELVTGRMQVGDNSFETHSPARVNVAGDADDPTGPTYRSFQSVLNAPAREQGATIIERIDREGLVSEDPSLQVEGVTAARYVPETRHTVAAPFWTFMTSSGMVYRDGQYATDSLFPTPYYATGLPITEAYWAEVKVGGSYQDVLMQCFERRCLTYTPGNSPGWQVEAGNVGLHYYAWRYEEGSSSPTTPTPDPSPSPNPSPTPDPDPSPTPDPGSSISSYEYTEAWDSQVIENSAFNEPYGIAVSPSGDIYITEIGEGEDGVQRYTPDGVLVTGWGSLGANGGQFDDPLGLATDADGYVYVVDYENDRVQKFDPYGVYVGTLVDDSVLNGPMDVAVDQTWGYVYIADNNNHRIVRITPGKEDQPLTFGSKGSGNGQLYFPDGIALDADGNVYVADKGNNRIQKFSPGGEWITSFGSEGDLADQFFSPRDVVVGADGRVYVVNSGNNQDILASIRVWEPLNEAGTEYGFDFYWNKSGADPDSFGFPTRIAMDQDGYIYVTERDSHRVQKFTSMGMLVDVWTDASRNAFGRPVGIDYGGGYLYAVDEELRQVKVFTTSGEFVRHWDDQMLRPVDIAVSDGYVYVADQKRSRVLKFTSEGEYVKSWGGYGVGPGEFTKPEGVAVDDGGYVYVLDSNTYLVQKFTSDGEYVRSWGSYGDGPGQFESPKGIAIYGDALYVVDSYQSRVQQFDLDGYYVRSWGGEGYMAGQFDSPYGVTVDRDGYVYVAERDNHRVQKFTADGEYVAMLTPETTGMPDYSSPIAVAAGSGGMLCVVSELIEGIMIFHPVSSN